MKPLNVLALWFLLGILSCNQENSITPIDQVTSVNAAWKTVDLNTDYTIQFPAETYDGRGYQFRSAASFGDQPTLITRKDEKAFLTATFCHPSAYPCLLLQYYGDGLETPLPGSVSFRNATGADDFLSQRVTFGRDGKLFAIFYYGINPGVTFRPYEGRLYTVSGETGLPEQTGSASFSQDTKQGLLDIMATITPK